MSSDLGTLIRLHRWRLDEKRRALAELQALAERLAGESKRLAEELAAEREVATQSTSPPIGFAEYAKAMLDRQKRLAESQAQVKRQIDDARDEIAAAFQEVKRYEIAQTERERRERMRREKLENRLMDEIGLTAYTRRRATEGRG